MRVVRSSFLYLLLAGVCWSSSPLSAEAPTAATQQITDDLKYLASDELEGRGIGTEGLNLAAEFIRKEFEKAGLDVTRINGGAYQPFSMTTGSELGEHNALTILTPDGKEVELKMDGDFSVGSFGGSGKLDHELVFVGYGIEAAKENYDEFAGVDVKDKVVIILRRVPRQGVEGSPFTGPHGSVGREASLTTKMSNAFQHGAKGVLFVNDYSTSRKEAQKKIEQAAKAVEKTKEALDKVDPNDEAAKAKAEEKYNEAVAAFQASQKIDNMDDLMPFGYGGHGQNQSLPVAHITQQVASELLEAATGKTLEQIEQEIDKDFKPQSQELKGWKVQGEISVKLVKAEVKNVIGVLEGEGPLKEETIIIGAHYDHVGRGGAGSLLPGSNAVHNGADDNASGTVSLIELARRLAADGKKYPRRLVFIAFTAEESGLIGSAEYVKNPLFPLDKTVAMFNMDMVGRMKDNELTIFGTGTSSRFKDQLEDLNKQYEFDIAMKPEGLGPSDHASFYAKKIPVLHFFTGTHGDYHRPSDDWDKINYEGMLQITGMIEDIVLATAENPERPDYVEIQSRATIARDGSRPYFGSIPDFGSQEPGYSISGVAPGSPADLGGLKGGDHLIQLGPHQIGDLNDFDLALRKFSAGDEVQVIVRRDGKKVTLTVKLSEPK